MTVTIEVVPPPLERQTIEVWRLRQARQLAGRGRAGYSMAVMAEKMNRSQSWVSNVEKGTTTITEADLRLWARVTSVTEDDLYGVGSFLGAKLSGRK